MKKFLQKLVVLTMLLGAVGGYDFTFNQPQTTVQAARHHVKRKIDHNKKKSKRLKTKKRISWANVYIAIPKNTSDYRASVDAVKAWNNTEVVKLRLVKKFSQAFIRIRRGNYGNTGWAGVEQYRRLKKRRIISEIHSNDYFMNVVDYPVGVAVVEHELGHSLGLDNTDGQPSVMNSVIDPDYAYQIQQIDIVHVKTLFFIIYIIYI
ncbi:MAG: matrixin family metalloprotease [Candidatus Lactobacillus pullistercoris]|uniref:Matrixin family metalloprotease n=1 Tax=Candidatus Lactobacillus pullistercoris TaxID=2838636 RepID=A0A9E2NV47_9LACO|nr:matrixin family metalloprotease [Candidatus Lactobacillus pullistercoris]